MNRKPAKTPWTSIARILKDMGLKQGPMGDFVVTGHKKNGERVGTYVVLATRKANDLVDENADEIERLSDESGWVFHVSTWYNHESGRAYPDICNFGERVRRERPGVEKPNPPISDALTINTERANADLANVVFEGDRVPAVYVAAGSALADTMRRLRSEDVAEATRFKNVMRTALENGFIRTHTDGAVPGKTQFVHATNVNVLIVTFSEGRFVAAQGHGCGEAPWAGHGWDTNDYDTFLRHITD